MTTLDEQVKRVYDAIPEPEKIRAEPYEFWNPIYVTLDEIVAATGMSESDVCHALDTLYDQDAIVRVEPEKGDLWRPPQIGLHCDDE